MNSLKTIIAATTLCTLALGFGAAQAAETVKPLQGISFHAGTKHAAVYFLNHNAGCKLVLTLADDVRYAPVRFEAAIADGSSKQYPFVTGTPLEFACHDRGQAMTVNLLTTIAAQR
jgi:hypothetical protein